jgi:hypothetical protein
MADIRKTVTFLKSFSGQNISSRYFFPPPFVESAYSMSVFTDLPIIYLEKGILSVDMLDSDMDNYIIFDDQATFIKLRGVGIGKEIYKNNNWVIYEVIKINNSQEEFGVKFQENFLEKIKSFLKS